MKGSTLLLFTLLLCFTNIFCQSPGVILTMGNSSFANGLSYQLPNLLTSYFENITIPEISGTTREFLLFEITYNLTQIFVESFTIGSVSIEFITNGLEINLYDVDCTATAQWSYVDQTLIIIHVAGSGNATMSFSGGTYQMQLLIEEKNGQPYLNLKKSDLELKNFNLELDAYAAPWFYDFFNFIISPIVKNEIESVTEGIIQQLIDDTNNVISKVPLVFPLIKGIGFDWSLLEDFDTTSSPGFGTFFTAGYFVPLAKPSLVPPFASNTLPSQVNFDLVQLIISQYTYNSLGWALYEAGSLNFTIPLGTTNDFRLIIPSLYRAFPDDQLKADIVGLTWPSITLSSASGLTFEFAPYMYWNVVQNGTLQNAFVLLLQIEAVVDLSFGNAGLLHGKVTVPTFDMSLFSSNIGQFSLLQLEIAFNTLINVIILPTINILLSQGINLPPIHGIELLNPQLEFGDGFMFIATSIQHVSNTTTVTSDSLTSFSTDLGKNLEYFTQYIQLEDEWPSM